MKKNKDLIILRGLPGSGKTTLARILNENGKHPLFSIDDFFTDPETGYYTFDHLKNHLAYKACEENTRKAMQEEQPIIFIHNTFTLEWEMEPYFKLAKEFHYRMHVLTVENYHHGKNIHDVSDDQVRKMAEKYKVVLF